MFVVLTYDVNQKRVGKALKICRRYLVRVQRSVFEGRITEAQLNKLLRELKSILNTDEDTVCVYEMESTRYINKIQIGIVEDNSHII